MILPKVMVEEPKWVEKLLEVKTGLVHATQWLSKGLMFLLLTDHFFKTLSISDDCREMNESYEWNGLTGLEMDAFISRLIATHSDTK